MLGEPLIQEQADANAWKRPCKRSLLKVGLCIAALAALLCLMPKPRDPWQKEDTRAPASELPQQAHEPMCVNGWKVHPKCVITSEYRGVTFHGCTTSKNDGKGWCSADPIYSGKSFECTACDDNCTSGACKSECLENWEPLPNCAPTFQYNGHTYTGCTSVNNNGQGWCSFDAVYQGHWDTCKRRSKPCHTDCINGFQLHSECAPSYTYNGVLYKGCTDTNDHQFWCSTSTVYHGEYRYCDSPCEISVCLNGWKPSKSCASTWKYKGLSYRGCAKAGGADGWCSWDAEFVEDSGRYSLCEACELPAPEDFDSSKSAQDSSYLPGFKFIDWPQPTKQPEFILPATVKSANELFHNFPVYDASQIHKSIKGKHFTALFDDFLKTLGSTAHGGVSPKRSFDTAQEYRDRLEVFSQNMLTVLKKNAKAQVASRRPDHARYGVTVFSDWKREEFLSFLKTSSPSLNNSSRKAKVTMHAACFTAGGPAEFGTPCVFPFVYNGMKYTDCTTANNDRTPWCATEVGVNYSYIGNKWGNCAAECTGKPFPCSGVVKVAARNQGSCGSCWAYSTAETIRQNHFWSNNWQDPGPLSTNYLINCDFKDGGCNGGNPDRAMRFIRQSGGIPTFAQYAASPRCSLTKSVEIAGPTYFHTEEEMAENFCERGGISISVDGTELQHYISGVLDHSSCESSKGWDYINHAPVIAGLDAKIGAWIVRNSWGLEYGVSPSAPYPKGGGHILMAYGEDTCNLQSSPVAAEGPVLTQVNPGHH